MSLITVRIIEPPLCISCRFASIAKVTMNSGETKQMFHCKRRDCDNWEYEEQEERLVKIDE